MGVMQEPHSLIALPLTQKARSPVIWMSRKPIVRSTRSRTAPAASTAPRARTAAAGRSPLATRAAAARRRQGLRERAAETRARLGRDLPLLVAQPHSRAQGAAAVDVAAGDLHIDHRPGEVAVEGDVDVGVEDLGALDDGELDVAKEPDGRKVRHGAAVGVEVARRFSQVGPGRDAALVRRGHRGLDLPQDFERGVEVDEEIVALSQAVGDVDAGGQEHRAVLPDEVAVEGDVGHRVEALEVDVDGGAGVGVAGLSKRHR